MSFQRLLAASSLLTLLPAGRLGNSHAGPKVWIAPSLYRVGPDEAPRPRASTTARLWAARGEYESFQIVVRAPGAGLTNVDVTVSGLRGPRNHSISRSNLALFREHYVHVDPGSPDWHGLNRPHGPGWYADALIPFQDPDTGARPSSGALSAVPFDLAANRNQPVWVDVFVPRDAQTGDYIGSYTVRSDQGSARGEVRLAVWNFTLPVKASLKSCFLYWGADKRRAAEELLRNKISPGNADPRDEKRLADMFGLASVNLAFWSGADNSRCSMSPPPQVSALRAAAARQLPGLFLYNYTADEIGKCTSLYPQIKQWGYNLHQAGIRNLVTISPTPALYDDGSGKGRPAVDIWTVLPIMYDQSEARVREVLQKGSEVWSYNALVQDAYSPKWLIDFDPVDYRIQPGFISQSLGLTGMLYWRVDRWSPDPWNEVNNAGIFSTANYPGEGMLVYPGRQAGLEGVAPSMRLKWLRDGVEDYEYVEILKKHGLGDWALEVARRVGQDWKHWTRDIDAIEAARLELGRRVDSISNPRGSTAPGE